MLVIGNTNMFEFKHPKYYKNLRKLARLRNRDQAISLQAPTGDAGRAPGTGLNHRRQEATGPGAEASSDKPQATDPQASSDKHQASSRKRQAPQ